MGKIIDGIEQVSTNFGIVRNPTGKGGGRTAVYLFDRDEVKDALYTSKGRLTQAARLLKKPYIALRRFVEGDEELSETLKECVLLVGDAAEDVYLEIIENPRKYSVEIRMKAAAFILQNRRHAARGYSPNYLPPVEEEKQNLLEAGNGFDVLTPQKIEAMQNAMNMISGEQLEQSELFDYAENEITEGVKTENATYEILK